MEAELTIAQFRKELQHLSKLTGHAGFRNVQQTFSHYIRRVDELATSEETISDIARDFLLLYSQGMGGFTDLILQNSQGILPEMDEFDEGRMLLYKIAVQLV